MVLKNISYGGDNIIAVILAAGIGSRLKENIPKALVNIGDNKTILEHQLQNLNKIIEMKNIYIVVGFKKDLILERYPYLSFIYNNNYKNTNTSKSLLIALEKFQDEDVLWINGDVIFEPEILLMIQKYSNNNLVCVKNVPVKEEEVKYTIDENGFIKDIAKEIENGLGEAVGINYIKKENIKQFISSLKECENLDYFEKGIELAIKNGVKFLALNVNKYFCMEVDFQEDLERAKNFFSRS